MANEIQSTSTLVITKDGQTITISKTELRTLVGTGKFTSVQAIGTSTEAIVFPADLIAEGVSEIAIINLGPTNFVEIGLNTPLTQVSGKLLVGQSMKVPVNKAPTVDPTWYAKADTAGVSIAIAAAGT